MATNVFPPVQQGEIDWDEFRSTIDSIPSELLSTYTIAGIDPQTIEIAKKLCSKFSVSENTQSNMGPSLELSEKNVKDENLKRVIRTLASSLDGLKFLAIFSLITYRFTIESCLTILRQLAVEYDIPTNLMPTTQAWESLIPLFEAHEISNDFMDEFWTTMGKERTPEFEELEHTTVETVVGALLSMSRLRLKKEKHVFVFGGADAGWIVAVADWLFALKMRVCAKGKESGFFEFAVEEELQMTIKFQNPDVPVDTGRVIGKPLILKEKKSKDS